MDAAESGSEAAGGFRASELEGAVSMHPATGAGGPLEIEPPSAVCGENAPMVRPHSGVAWGQGPEMKLGLLGGADRPPQPAAPESDFPAVYRRLRDLRTRYDRLSKPAIVYDFELAAITRVSRRVMREFGRVSAEQGGSWRSVHPASPCGGASVPLPPGNGPPSRRRRQFRASRRDPRGPGYHRQACRRGFAIAVQESLHRRSPVHPGDAATSRRRPDRRDSRSHPNRRPTLPINPTGSPPTGSCATCPGLLGHWLGSPPMRTSVWPPNAYHIQSHAQVQEIRRQTRTPVCGSQRRHQGGTGVPRHPGHVPSKLKNRITPRGPTRSVRPWKPSTTARTWSCTC